jgi:hypothetical protein
LKEILKSKNFLQDSGGLAEADESENSKGAASFFSKESSGSSSSSENFNDRENSNSKKSKAPLKRKYETFESAADLVYSDNSSERDSSDGGDSNAFSESDEDDDEEAAEIRARGLDQVSNCSSSSGACKSDCHACFCTQEEAREQKINLERCKTCRDVYCGACGLFECSKCNANLCGDCKLTIFEDWVCFNCLDSIVQLNGYNLV